MFLFLEWQQHASAVSGSLVPYRKATQDVNNHLEFGHHNNLVTDSNGMNHFSESNDSKDSDLHHTSSHDF